jgi:hypothetical protein
MSGMVSAAADSGQCLYVIRHGERLDEIEPQEWEGQVSKMYRCAEESGVALRAMDCTYADAPLTARGVQMAKDMAVKFKRKLDTDGVNIKDLKCIYCSRLLRAIQTAYEVAKALELPLVISAHLSCTALAVFSYCNQKRGGDGWEHYEYRSMSEIATYCPGIPLYCHDADPDPDDCFCFARRAVGPEPCAHPFACPPALRFSTHFEEIAIRRAEQTAASTAAKPVSLCAASCNPMSLFGGDDEERAAEPAPAVMLPNQWYNALTSICASSADSGGKSVVVAHRETIRGLEEYGRASSDAASFEYSGHRLGSRALRSNIPPPAGVNWRRTKLPYCAVAKYANVYCGGAGEYSLELTDLCNHLCEPLDVSYFSRD